MLRKAVLLLGAALLLFLSSFLSSCDAPKGEASSPASDPSGDTPILVKLGDFERGDISDKLPVSADLEAVHKADVFPEISGPIKEVAHRLGDRVKKDEPVVRLVDDHLKLLVETKRSLAAQAKGKVGLAALARREVAEVVRQKKLLLEKAQSEYERTQKLAGDPAKLVSYEEEEAKRYLAAQAEIDYKTCLLQAEKFELDHAQALESQRFAEVEQRTAEYNLSQATLRSPIDGFIYYLLVKPGELVTASSRVFSVVDISELEARLHVPQRELARVRTDLPVRIVCEVFPEKSFLGRVEVVNPVVDKDGTVEVLVGVKDPDSFLKPGMFVNGEIILDTRQSAVLVSKKAISYDDQQPIVFLVQEGIARRYVLKPGYSNREAIEVLALLGADGKPVSPSDGRLVLIGHDNLKEGSKVEAE